jgi:tRNA G37 N-methylase TrmD
MVKKQKIQFDIITIYPECFQSYLSCAIFNKAIKLGIVKIKIHNLRD